MIIINVNKFISIFSFIKKNIINIGEIALTKYLKYNFKEYLNCNLTFAKIKSVQSLKSNEGAVAIAAPIKPYFGIKM